MSETVSLVRHEVQRIGWLALAAPLIVLTGFTALAIFMALSGADRDHVARVMLAGIELGVPLVAGVMTASALTLDPAIEVQIASVTGFRRTALRRSTILSVWNAGFCLGWALLARASGLWPADVPGPFLLGQLSWLAPLAWLSAAGALLGVLTRSRSASAGLIGALWLVENLAAGLFVARPWLQPVFLFATT